MLRVLVVGDQIEVGRMLRAALEALRPDLSMTSIPSAEEALLVLTRQPFDLAVLDVHLPGISGLELMRKARQHQPDLKVILISGLADPKMRQKIADAGADDHFFKPLEMPDFLKSVENCLQRVRKRDIEDAFDEVTLEKGMELEGRIPDLLSRIRDQIAAISVYLIDPNGLVLARSGDPPAELAVPWLLSSAAGLLRVGADISSSLGMDAPRELMCFPGRRYHLVLLRSGQVMMAAIMHAIDLDKRCTAVFGQVHPFLDEISRLLPSKVQSSCMENYPAPDDLAAEIERMDAEPPGLEGIFNLANRDGYETEDIHTFWEAEGPGNEQNSQPGDGRISFEQAKALGLTSDD